MRSGSKLLGKRTPNGNVCSQCACSEHNPRKGEELHGVCDVVRFKFSSLGLPSCASLGRGFFIAGFWGLGVSSCGEREEKRVQ